MKGPEKLYEGNMRKKYLLFAIPLILSALLSQSYNFINSMLIGKFLGSEAFAATAATAELIEFFNSIFFGYLTGVGIYVSVLFGRNEKAKILNVIKLNFLISTIFAITISVLCNVFCGQIFDLLNVNDEIYKNAESYFRIYVSGLAVFQFNWGFTYIANGMGMTKLPLLASVLSGVFNVSLNYLFLSVLGLGIGYKRIFSIAVVTGIIEVVGTFIGYFAVTLSTAILPFALSFAGGTMLYVISDETLSETHAHGSQRGATYSLIIGFCVMLLFDTLLG